MMEGSAATEHDMKASPEEQQLLAIDMRLSGILQASTRI
jgi:hypothetical protein